MTRYVCIIPNSELMGDEPTINDGDNVTITINASPSNRDESVGTVVETSHTSDGIRVVADINDETMTTHRANCVAGWHHGQLGNISGYPCYGMEE